MFFVSSRHKESGVFHTEIRYKFNTQYGGDWVAIGSSSNINPSKVVWHFGDTFSTVTLYQDTNFLKILHNTTCGASSVNTLTNLFNIVL